MPDESNLYPELTGINNLCFCAALQGMRKEPRRARARELLEMFGLEAGRLRPSLEDVFVRITGIEADTMRKEKEKTGGGA